jgi:hypothetical protein
MQQFLHQSIQSGRVYWRIKDLCGPLTLRLHKSGMHRLDVFKKLAVD